MMSISTKFFNTIINQMPLVGKRMMVACLVFGTICVLLSSTLILIDFVQIATTQLTKVTIEGSRVFDHLNKPMDGAHVWVYLFNITNHEKFILGKDYKLKMEEVGPFIFKETRYNDDILLDHAMIKYDPRTMVGFERGGSVDYPENVIITVPNLALLDLTSIVSSKDSTVKLGWHHLTNKMNSKAVITTTASRFLHESSRQNKPLSLLAYNVIPHLNYLENFGLLDRFYKDMVPNHLEVSSRDVDKFVIRTRNWFWELPMGDFEGKERNTEKKFDTGSLGECKDCNDFINTYEGYGYPPGITPDFPINLFRNGLCRTLPMFFHKKVTLDDGLRGFIYNLSDDFFTQQPYGDKNGLLNLTKCYKGSPTIFSKVRFQGVDPKLYERIELIERDPKDNGYIIVEPHIALNLKMYLPIQMNLMLGNLSFHVEAEPFSNMIIPIGYVEIIQPPIEESVQEAIHLLFVVIPRILLEFEVFLMSLGIYLLMLYTKSKKHRKSVIKEVTSDTEILLLDKYKKIDTGQFTAVSK